MLKISSIDKNGKFITVTIIRETKTIIPIIEIIIPRRGIKYLLFHITLVIRKRVFIMNPDVDINHRYKINLLSFYRTLSHVF